MSIILTHRERFRFSLRSQELLIKKNLNFKLKLFLKIKSVCPKLQHRSVSAFFNVSEFYVFNFFIIENHLAPFFP